MDTLRAVPRFCDDPTCVCNQPIPRRIPDVDAQRIIDEMVMETYPHYLALRPEPNVSHRGGSNAIMVIGRWSLGFLLVELAGIALWIYGCSRWWCPSSVLLAVFLSFFAFQKSIDSRRCSMGGLGAWPNRSGISDTRRES